MRNNHSVSTRESLAKSDAQNFSIALVPIEWYGSNCWRLPSGKALGEFALQAGFLAPVLLKAEVPAGAGVLSFGTGSSRRSGRVNKAGGS